MKGVLTIGIGCMAVIAIALAILRQPSAETADAKSIYADMCASCHGDHGRGDGPAGQAIEPKPADFATALKGRGDDYIAKVIRGGGKAVGKSPAMPALGEGLSDEEINSLVDYVKHLASS